MNSSIFLNFKNETFNFFFCFFACFSYSCLFSQEFNSSNYSTITQKVVPNNFSTTTGTNPFQSPFSSNEITYQLLIAASQLTDLVGKNLVSISFRNTFDATTAWPDNETFFNNYAIYLGQSVAPADRTLVFAQNAIGLITLVRSSSLIVPTNALTAGSNPNNFSYDIPFSTPYFYNGGNLLVEIRHFGTVGFSRRVDSVSTSTPGYGTLFSASWYPSNVTSSNNALEDSFTVINFKAENTLSAHLDKKEEILIYPNPTGSQITLSSPSKILNYKIFDIMGQTILSQNHSQKNLNIDLTTLNKGTYLLQIESELGREIKKIIKL